MTMNRLTLAFYEFVLACIEETGSAPVEIILPNRTFDQMARNLAPMAQYVCAPGETLGFDIILETGAGKVHIRPVSNGED